MSEVSLNLDNTVVNSSKNDGGSIPLMVDSSHTQITTVKFDSNNYLTWSKSIFIFIQGKDKEYLMGEAEIPPMKGPCYRKLNTENVMVMGWLLSSMKLEIINHYPFLETTHQIWDALSKAYSKIGHATKVYEL